MSEPRFAFLTDHAVIAVSGRDARKFLHAQLTQDIEALAAERAALAAWADARGRVRAVFRVLPGARWLLVTSADLVAKLLPQLLRFVLRDDVVLEHAVELSVAVLVGDSTAWLASRNVTLAVEANALAEAHGITWLRGGAELVFAVGPPDAIRAVCKTLVEVPSNQAELALIRAGLPTIGAAQSGQYTPHMLNLDRLDGISFDKGCYPGQEVIERISTYGKGRAPRRLCCFSIAGERDLAAGTEILTKDGVKAGYVTSALFDPANEVTRILASLETKHSDEVLSDVGQCQFLAPPAA